MDKIILERLKMMAFFLSLFSMIMLGASCGGNSWVNQDKNSFGLWKICKESECHFIKDIKGTWFQVTRIFVVIACAFLLIAFMITLLNRVLLAAVVYLMSAMFLMIGLSIFVDRISFETVHFDYGWSFVLGWVSFVSISMASGFCILGTDGMVEKIKKKASYVVLVGSSVIFVISIISCASNYWIQWTQDQTGLELAIGSRGLWKICSNVFNHTVLSHAKCYHLEDYFTVIGQSMPAWLYATRLFSVLACLSSGSATLAALACLKLPRFKKEIAPGFLVFAVVSLLITLSYYTHETRKQVTNEIYLRYSWGFIFGWVGLALALDISFIGFLNFILPWADVAGHQVFVNEPQ